jgi:hypothetical protein
MCSEVPDESRVGGLIGVAIIFGSLALAAIGLRTYSRYTVAHRLGPDDWTLIATVAPLIALIVLQIYGM